MQKSTGNGRKGRVQVVGCVTNAEKPGDVIEITVPGDEPLKITATFAGNLTRKTYIPDLLLAAGVITQEERDGQYHQG